MTRYTFSNGVTVPKIGFGTWQIPDGEVAYGAVSYALELVIAILILLKFMAMKLVLVEL